LEDGAHAMINPVLKKLAQRLFTLSDLEQGRVDHASTHTATAWNHVSEDTAEFKTLEAMVQHSLKKPEWAKTRTPQGQPLTEPKPVNRSFIDEELMTKLLKFRDRIPLSSRIIRR
jgi:hypothetical protein